MMKLSRVIPLVFSGALLAGGTMADTEELSAAEIVQQAFEIDGGKDGISRVTFIFQQPGAAEKKLVYTMVWRGYGGKDGVDSKVLFFSEYPPDDRGKSFMAYVKTDKKDDQWMYLPELRMVRKITHGHHQRTHEDDDFAHSQLTHGDLVPRLPDEDEHQLQGVEEWKGRLHYVVESVPKQKDEIYPYSKTLRWFEQDTFLPVRVDYYNELGELFKRQTIAWRKFQDSWLWERVESEELKSGKHTLMEISDIEVNLGLRDEVFSPRTMRLGPGSIQR